MLNTRFGALPDTDVRMPHPLVNAEQPVCVLVSRSSCCPKIALLKFAFGRQEPRLAALLENCRLPFEPTFAVVNGCPYRLYVKGSAIPVVQSSQWLPVSVVPATMMAD